jgi:adenosylmethionine-8-amino-7-oxononanoate aminotransferase
MVYALDLVKNKETKAKMGKESQYTKRLNELVMEHGLVTRIWDVLHLARRWSSPARK